MESEVGTMTDCRTCARCLGIKEGGRVICARYLELQEPADCKEYKPIKGAGQ